MAVKWVVTMRVYDGQLKPGIAKILNPDASPHQYEFEFVEVVFAKMDSARMLVDKLNELERGKQE